jgi:WD40 repeat protein
MRHRMTGLATHWMILALTFAVATPQLHAAPPKKPAETKPTSILNGHAGSVTDVAFSADSTKLVSSGVDMTVRLWDVVKGKPLKTIVTEQSKRVVAKGKAVTAADWVKALKAYDADMRASMESLPQRYRPRGGITQLHIAWQPQTPQFAARDSQERASGYRGQALSVAFAADGAELSALLPSFFSRGYNSSSPVYNMELAVYDAASGKRSRNLDVWTPNSPNPDSQLFNPRNNAFLLLVNDGDRVTCTVLREAEGRNGGASRWYTHKQQGGELTPGNVRNRYLGLERLVPEQKRAAVPKAAAPNAVPDAAAKDDAQAAPEADPPEVDPPQDEPVAPEHPRDSEAPLPGDPAPGETPEEPSADEPAKEAAKPDAAAKEQPTPMPKVPGPAVKGPLGGGMANVGGDAAGGINKMPVDFEGQGGVAGAGKMIDADICRTVVYLDGGKYVAAGNVLGDIKIWDRQGQLVLMLKGHAAGVRSIAAFPENTVNPPVAEPAADEPVAEEPAEEKPAEEKPAADEKKAEEPAAEKPAEKEEPADADRDADAAKESDQKPDEGMAEEAKEDDATKEDAVKDDAGMDDAAKEDAAAKEEYADEDKDGEAKDEKDEKDDDQPEKKKVIKPGEVDPAAASSPVLLASVDGKGTIRLWSREGKVIRRWTSYVAARPDGEDLTPSSQAEKLAFSPDGKSLAASTTNGAAAIWDTATGKESRMIEAHGDLGFGVAWAPIAYSPCGQYLATAGTEGTVKVWDPKTGYRVLILRGHTDDIWGLAISPDGKFLASAGRDATIRLWNLPEAIAAWKIDPHPEWDLIGIDRQWKTEKGEVIYGEIVGVDKNMLTVTERGFFGQGRGRTRRIMLAALSQADRDYVNRRMGMETEP